MNQDDIPLHVPDDGPLTLNKLRHAYRLLRHIKHANAEAMPSYVVVPVRPATAMELQHLPGYVPVELWAPSHPMRERYPAAFGACENFVFEVVR